MRQLILREYETTAAVPLTSGERDALARLVPSLTIKPVAAVPGHYDLTPGSLIGGVTINDLAIAIRPKIPIDRLLFLISYTLHRRRWQEFCFPADPERDLVEAVALGFLAQANRALTTGLLHGYQHREDAGQTVRGRIRFGDQIRSHYGRMPPVEIAYDEFTTDIDENRLLKAATRRLRRLPLRSQTIRQRLLALDVTLADVSTVSFDPRVLPGVRYSRLNAHYRPAVELAKLILHTTSYELRHGVTDATALLVDMNTVFEDFMVVTLRDALALSEHAFPQGATGRTLHLDEAREVALHPDISWWDGPNCLFVGDVKYKHTVNGDAVNADIYQLLAYAVATNLPAGLLIYAGGEATERIHDIAYARKRLTVVTLNLARTPMEILAQVELLAAKIRTLRHEAISPERPRLQRAS